MTTTPLGRPEPPGTPRPHLVFTDPTGRRRTAPARFGPASRRDPALPQRIRNGLLDDRGQQCVQVFLSAADAANPAARTLLDTEAGTALRLDRTLENTPYAHLFPTVIGYELDTAEPFLLYAAPRGAPVGRTHVMSASDQRVFARDLTLALCLLDGQGLVARGISPRPCSGTVRRCSSGDLRASPAPDGPGHRGAGPRSPRPNSTGARATSTPGTRCGAPPRCSTSS